MLKKTNLGFTLIELLIAMVITGVLMSIGISGYMDTLIVERRRDAVLALQRAILIINSEDRGGGNSVSSIPVCKVDSSGSMSYYSNSSTNDNCLSEQGFYIINYDAAGYTATILNNLLSGEKAILRATARSSGSQSKDITACKVIYLTNFNNFYPEQCTN